MDMAAVKDMGGLVTDGLEQDPVSGNEVPPGSNSEDVRDDVDAKLSPNEYVVPADVLRFFGVAFFEDLRRKAKAGLAEMDADGRIGGGMPEEEDDFPFSVEELEVEDDMAFAEGGVVPSGTSASPVFNPNDFSYDSSMGFGGSSGPTEVKKFKDKNGNVVNVLFINGKPVVDIQALGYTEYTEETPVATGEEVATPEKTRESSSDRDTSPPPERKPIDPAENYYNISAEALLNPDYSTLKDTKGAGLITKVGTALLGPGVALGAGAINSFQQAQNLADVRARKLIAEERNLDTSSLDAIIKDMEKDASGIVKGLDVIGLDGKGIRNQHQKDKGSTPPPTQPPVSSGVTTAPRSGSGGGSGSRDSWTPTSGGEGTSRGVTSVRTGVTEDGGYSTSTTTESTAPTSSPRPPSRPTTTAPSSVPSGSVSTLNPSYGTTGTVRGGRAKGGLVEKPQKIVKPKTKRRTKI